MTLGSLFDGSGTCCLAAEMCGIEPVWSSEIEPFPRKVTESRFPNVKHYGDITKLSGYELEPVDIITGGFPCQSLSVAGKREGIHHTDIGDKKTTESGLFIDMIRIIKEMRENTNGEYPKYIMAENVPGALSSTKGEDFRLVLEKFIEVATGEAHSIPRPKKWSTSGIILGDNYSITWRVLDSQWVGVPQRRRRIYLVCDLTGQRAGEILLKRQSMSWNFASRRQSREGITVGSEGSSGETSRETGESGLEPFTCGNGQGDIVGHISHNLAGTLDTMHDQQIVCEPPKDVYTVELGVASRDGGHFYKNVSGTIRAIPGDNRMSVVEPERSRIKNLNKGDIQSKTVLDPSGISTTLYSGECQYGGGEMYVLDNDNITASPRTTISGKETFGCLEASMASKLWLTNQEAFSGDYFIAEPESEERERERVKDTNSIKK